MAVQLAVDLVVLCAHGCVLLVCTGGLMRLFFTSYCLDPFGMEVGCVAVLYVLIE